VKGRMVEIPQPSKCQFYSPDKTRCVLEIKDFLEKCKVFYLCEKHKWDEIKIAQSLAADSIADAALSRQVEILTKGHPAGYTHLFSESAAKQVGEIHKMKYGEVNKNLNVNIDLADAAISAFRKRKEEKLEEENGS